MENNDSERVVSECDAIAPLKEERKVVLTFQNLTVKTEMAPVRCILNGVTGTIAPGVTAIMGPTGSGKSVLLNTLMGHVPVGLVQTAGERRINGKSFTPHQIHFGYCLQSDDLNGHLTAFETLRYAADLLLAHSSTEERNKRVEEVLHSLGLLHVRDVLVGTQSKKGLSGGQRKRVSIGLAMLAAPQLLILDEPTAGLDSVTAMNLVELLKQLAVDNKITILCVIHQPQRAIFELLDRLLLLRSGEIIYDGVASECVPYFESLGLPYDGVSNPADHIMESISPCLGETAVHLEKRCKVRQAYRKPQVDLDDNNEQPLPTPHEAPTRLHQFSVLARRQFKQELRDVNMHLLNCFATLMCGFLIGGVWYQIGNTNASVSKRTPSVFFCVINQSLFGAMKAVLHFPDQKSTILRERRAKLYTTLPAFLAWSIVDFMITVPWSAIFAIITYFMIGLRTDYAGHFFLYFLILVLDKNTASSMAIMICTWTAQIQLPTVILPVILELSRLFGGFFLPPALLPSYYIWLDPLSYVKYAYLGAVSNELLELPLCDPVTQVCTTASSGALVSSLGLNYLSVGGCIGVLIAFIIFTRTVAYLFLLFKKA